MSPRELLANLRNRGVGIYLGEDNRVHLCGQAVDDLPQGEVRAIAVRQKDLLPILAAERAAGWRPWWPPAPDAPCRGCGGTRFALSAGLSGWLCVTCRPLPTPPVAFAGVAAEEVRPSA